ncbi:MAG: DDE-type integrase/transposase/recombinase, partial [Candidatus Helarchaeales archaeon]
MTPLKIACWRFELISSLLDPSLSGEQRHCLAIELSKNFETWPSGRVNRVPVSTIYRWLALYRENPKIESLMPEFRFIQKKSPAIHPDWIQYALGLVEEEPNRSIYMLGIFLREKFSLKKAPPASSLYLALQKESRYRRAKKCLNNKKKKRVRFQAAYPHLIWHADAKSKFKVCFSDGTQKTVQILTLLDDATRFVLCAIIIFSESLKAAITVFRKAAARFGLPDKFYADRGSAYDSDVFRKGLAILGIHRIETKSRNPEAHGKIEVYHRSLKRWFIKELAHQHVLNLRHLQELLDAVVDQVINEHVHRELK